MPLTMWRETDGRCTGPLASGDTWRYDGRLSGNHQEQMVAQECAVLMGKSE